MVVGAVAVDALGIPRATVDIDVQVSLERPPPVTESAFLGRCIEERARDPAFAQDALLVHSAVDPVPVELVFTTHWFARQAFARRRAHTSVRLGRAVDLPTAEDIVLLKSAFGIAPSRSRRKAAQVGVDIENVVKANPRLDQRYLEENARKLGTWEALSEILVDPAR